MALVQRLHSAVVLVLVRSRAAGLEGDGGVGEQTVIRGLIIAAAIIVVGVIVAAVASHAHAIAHTINGAGG
ncbi:MAG TPA: hypothetical protein VE152_13270 [Acidimicrobiales bacterium]|nr:hypothetical protein [Acidimicrobiales bacterium]